MRLRSGSVGSMILAAEYIPSPLQLMLESESPLGKLDSRLSDSPVSRKPGVFRFGGNRESGNPRFPIRPGVPGEAGPGRGFPGLQV